MSNYQLSINTYQVPEGYKQTEVGVIPENWDVKAVGEICDFIVPGRNKPKNFKGDIPWITTPDLEDGRSVSTSKVSLFVSRDEAKSVGSKIVPKGSVLMSCVGELGIVAFVEREIVINQQLHAFIPTKEIDAFFLLNALQARKDYMLGIATITAVPYLNKDNCNSIPIPLPPLPEQQAIAQALSDVDALIAALDKLIAKKRHLKTATMQQLLTGKKRLPGFGEGKGYQQTEVGIIPEDWSSSLISELTSEVGDGLHSTPLYSNNGEYYFVNGNNLLNGEIIVDAETKRADASEYRKHKKNLNERTILLSINGTIGNLASYKNEAIILGKSAAYLNVRKEVSKRYFYYALQTRSVEESFEDGLTGTTIRNLGLMAIRNTPVAIPKTVEEQRAIATVLSDMDAEIAALEARRAKTQALKQGMMQELLTGRTRLI